MYKKLATLWAYKKAPRTTFFAKHPTKATKIWLGVKGLKSTVGRRTGLVLGAIAALPLGIWMAVRRGG